MNKITLFDRRSIESIEFNTKVFSEKCSVIGMKQASSNNSDSINNGSNNTNGSNGKDSSHVRLNIKIYSDPNYDENSYVGFVRIPLDPETFMPLEKSNRINW
uniref:Uncharacterized protein n=1 Tax=Panagrolaimus davidi TaxID=227884 RepID=A0A914PPU1_9BILA